MDDVSSRGGGRLAELESLRALAAFLILAQHVLVYHGLLFYYGDRGLGTELAKHLEVGVPVFFVLSGFLLYRPWVLASTGAANPPNVGHYFRRRLARIVPAFWLALTVSAVLGLTNGPIDHEPWVYYGFLQVYHVATFANGIAPAWSLCVEMSFYLVLPLIAVVVLRWFKSSRSQAALAAAAFTLVLAARAASLRYGHPFLADTLVGTFDWFLIGMVLCTIFVRGRLNGNWLTPPRAVSGAVALFVAIGLLRLTWAPPAFSRPTATEAVVQHVMYGAVAALLLWAALASTRHGGFINTLLTSRIAQWLGRISYGIFLWHVPAIFAVEKLAARGLVPRPLAAQVAFVLLATVLAASLSWYGLERFVLRSKFARGGRTTRARREEAPGLEATSPVQASA